MPIGDGVTYSFSSPLISAITPSNGAIRRVFSSVARVTPTRARLTAAVARAASHAASAALAAEALIGLFFGDEIAGSSLLALGLATRDWSASCSVPVPLLPR